MRAARVVLGVFGVAAAAYGVVLALRMDLPDLLDMVLWLLGAAVLHDAVVAPVTVVAVVLLRRVLAPAWRTPVTVGAVVLLGVTATAVPVLGRFGARPDNPTLLDRDYLAGWLVLAAISLLVVVVLRWRPGSRPDERPDERPDGH